MICIQAATRHDHVAVVTGLYLATFNIGSACGSTLSDATLTRTLVSKLMDTLPEPYHNNRSFAEGIRSSPAYFTERYPIGTPVRDSMISSYRHVHGLLVNTSLGLCAVLILFSLCIHNTELVDRQSHPDAETDDMYEGIVYEDQGWVAQSLNWLRI